MICVHCGDSFTHLGELCTGVRPERFHEPPSTREQRNADAAEFVDDLRRAAHARDDFLAGIRRFPR